MQDHNSLQAARATYVSLWPESWQACPLLAQHLAFVLLAAPRFTTFFYLSCVVCKQQHGRWCRPAMMVSSMQAIASSITYPHEVVRSQMHVRCLGPFDGFGLICKEIWQNEGLVGFYKGWATNMFRTVPAAAITFTSFELFARLVREAGARQRATKESR